MRDDEYGDGAADDDVNVDDVDGEEEDESAARNRDSVESRSTETGAVRIKIRRVGREMSSVKIIENPEVPGESSVIDVRDGPFPFPRRRDSGSSPSARR